MQKRIGIVALAGCISFPFSLCADALHAASSVLNANTASYPRAETKKEFMQRLSNAHERSRILKNAGDNQPYQDVEKTLKAEWKSGFIEKNPGKFALILVGSFAAIGALLVYGATH